MEKNKIYFDEFHIAGREYYDASEAWKYLAIGTKLKLVRDADNRYDSEAVAVTYLNEDGEEFVLGYVPRGHNSEIAKVVDMGWGDMFDLTLSQIDGSKHYEQQLRATLKIVRRESDG